MANLRDLHVGPGRQLPARLLTVRFSCSGGPGGQHVNKVATRADLRLDLQGVLDCWGAGPVALIRNRLAGRIDASGNLQIVCSEYREQGRNVEAAILRLEALLRGALTRPKPRKATKPSRASQRRRLEEKRRRSQTKRLRRGGFDE